MMGYYLAFDDFYNEVSSLENLAELGMSEFSFEKGRVYKVGFRGQKVSLVIEYSPTNDLLDFIFVKDAEPDLKGLSDTGKTLNMSAYLAAQGNNRQFFFAFSPKIIGLSNSLKVNVYLLHHLCSDILQGRFWVSNRDIIDGYRLPGV